MRSVLCQLDAGPKDFDVQLTNWNDDPESIHEYKVPIVVVRLGAGVHLAEQLLVKDACGVVENIAIKLAEGNDDLKGMTERMIRHDHVGHNG
jgi:hypothetical protein